MRAPVLHILRTEEGDPIDMDNHIRSPTRMPIRPVGVFNGDG